MPFLSKSVILNISWNDLQLHILNRQRSYTPSRDEKVYKNGPFAKLWILDKNDRLTPCHFCQKVSFFTFHEMICNYIFWIDRDHTLLLEMKRYENGPFAKLWILDKNDRLTPCHFCQKVPFFTFHEMICNYIFWIDRDHTLLLEMKRYKNGPFAKLWILDKNDRLTPCHFCQKVSF